MATTNVLPTRATGHGRSKDVSQPVTVVYPDVWVTPRAAIGSGRSGRASLPVLGCVRARIEVHEIVIMTIDMIGCPMLAGTRVRVTGEFLSEDDPADPTTVVLRVRNPSAAVADLVVTAGQVVKDGPGFYHADILLSLSGKYDFEWIGTGAVAAVSQESFSVVTVSGLPAP